MPADYNSKHLKPITNTHLSQQKREDLMVDDAEDVHIHEGYHGRLATPSVDMIKQAVKGDKVYKDLNEAGTGSRAKTQASVNNCQCGMNYQ